MYNQLMCYVPALYLPCTCLVRDDDDDQLNTYFHVMRFRVMLPLNSRLDVMTQTLTLHNARDYVDGLLFYYLLSHPILAQRDKTHFNY